MGLAGSEPKGLARGAFTAWVRQREAAIAEVEPLTIGQIMVRYLESRRIEGKSSVIRMGHNWIALRETFEHLYPRDVASEFEVRGEKRTRCHQYAVDRQKAGRARDTIATELVTLRTALNWAAKHRLIDKAPHVWVPKAGKVRNTHLTEEEALRLLDCATAPHIRLLLLIALMTGARKSAICELTWAQVDLERHTIDFRRTGGDDDILDSSHIKGRAFVDVHPVLAAALAEAKAVARTHRVIEWKGKPVDNPKQGVLDAVKRAGLAGRYIGTHALRHTLATMAADRDVDMRKIQRMLGHSDIRTTERVYASHSRGYTMAAADAVAGRIQKPEL